MAYLLSLPDVSAYLRGQESVPAAMIEYLRRLAYSRSPSNPGALAVWNGIDADKVARRYSFWIGDPTQDVEVPKSTKPPPTPPTPYDFIAGVYTCLALKPLSTFFLPAALLRSLYAGCSGRRTYLAAPEKNADGKQMGLGNLGF